MRGQGLLVLNEKMPDRARILLQNVERMGVTNAVVTCADPAALADRFEGYFDKILVDAPCSGEGMLRKEAAAAAEWSEQNVLMCADRQAKILESAARMLAPGGALVYSTCTFSREEDEDNAARFAAAHPDFVKCEEIKLYPHRVRGEGHCRPLHPRAGERIFRPAKFTADRRPSRRGAFRGRFLAAAPAGAAASFGEALCLSRPGSSRWTVEGAAPGLPSAFRGGRFEPAHALALACRAPPSPAPGLLGRGDRPLPARRGIGGGREGLVRRRCRGYPVGLGNSRAAG